jgi:hypothetical protein
MMLHATNPTTQKELLPHCMCYQLAQVKPVVGITFGGFYKTETKRWFNTRWAR